MAAAAPQDRGAIGRAIIAAFPSWVDQRWEATRGDPYPRAGDYGFNAVTRLKSLAATAAKHLKKGEFLRDILITLTTSVIICLTGENQQAIAIAKRVAYELTWDGIHDVRVRRDVGGTVVEVNIKLYYPKRDLVREQFRIITFYLSTRSRS